MANAADSEVHVAVTSHQTFQTRMPKDVEYSSVGGDINKSLEKET